MAGNELRLGGIGGSSRYLRACLPREVVGCRAENRQQAPAKAVHVLVKDPRPLLEPVPGGHSPASPPSSATGEDRRDSTTRPGQ